MKVIVDSNLLVSALVSGGGPAALVLDAWRRRRFQLVTSEEQLDEVRRVTRYPRVRSLISATAAGVLVNRLREASIVLETWPTVDRSLDPADNFLLGMAEASKADYLATGDKRHLLTLERHLTTRIVTARQLLEALGVEP
jgi:hypothetical protein